MTEASEAASQLLRDLTAPITKAADLEREFRVVRSLKTEINGRGYLSECPNDDCRLNNQAEPLCFSFVDIGQQIVGYCFAGCNNPQSVAIYPALQLRAQWLESQWSQAADKAMLDKALEALPLPHSRRPPRALPLKEFLALKAPPVVEMCGPWLREQTLSMVHAWRGAGKSWFGLHLAYCVSAGVQFLRWDCKEAHRVVYVDGEMSIGDTQGRLIQIIRTEEHKAGRELETKFSMLSDSNVAQFPEGIPRLGTLEGKALIEAQLQEGPTLLVLDNLSTLFNVPNENEAAAWVDPLDWLRSLRRRGHSVVLIQHSGKSGLQRSSSKLEDPLNNVIALKKPSNQKGGDSAAFTLVFEKSRGVHGPAVAPLDAKLVTDEYGFLAWVLSTTQGTNPTEIRELRDAGATYREIAKACGVGLATVKRALDKTPPKENCSEEISEGGRVPCSVPPKGGGNGTPETHPLHRNKKAEQEAEQHRNRKAKSSLLEGNHTIQHRNKKRNTSERAEVSVTEIDGQTRRQTGTPSSIGSTIEESNPPPEPAIDEEIYDQEEEEVQP